MTRHELEQEKFNQAKDIIATMLSWDCTGLRCTTSCPFYNPSDSSNCMIITAYALWDKINKGEAYGKKLIIIV